MGLVIAFPNEIAEGTGVCVCARPTAPLAPAGGGFSVCVCVCVCVWEIATNLLLINQFFPVFFIEFFLAHSVRSSALNDCWEETTPPAHTCTVLRSAGLD